MSKLNQIKPKAKVILKKAHFDFEDAEVSYTTPDKGGAASLKNNAYLFKSMEAQESQDTTADTEVEGGNTGETAEKISKINKQDEAETLNEEMIKAMQAEIEQLKMEKAVEASAKAFSKYELTEELNKSLSTTFIETAQVEVIVKALDAVITAKDEAMTKALESSKEENTLQKTLLQEEGSGEKPAQEPVSLVQKALKQYKEGVK